MMFMFLVVVLLLFFLFYSCLVIHSESRIGGGEKMVFISMDLTDPSDSVFAVLRHIIAIIRGREEIGEKNKKKPVLHRMKRMKFSCPMK